MSLVAEGDEYWNIDGLSCICGQSYKLVIPREKRMLSAAVFRDINLYSVISFGWYDVNGPWWRIQ
jgi:hypothetical protein